MSIQLSVKWGPHPVLYNVHISSSHILMLVEMVGNNLLISEPVKLISRKSGCFKAGYVNCLSFIPLVSQVFENDSYVLSREFSVELLVTL